MFPSSPSPSPRISFILHVCSQDDASPRRSEIFSFSCGGILSVIVMNSSPTSATYWRHCESVVHGTLVSFTSFVTQTFISLSVRKLYARTPARIRSSAITPRIMSRIFIPFQNPLRIFPIIHHPSAASRVLISSSSVSSSDFLFSVRVCG